MIGNERVRLKVPIRGEQLENQKRPCLTYPFSVTVFWEGGGDVGLFVDGEEGEQEGEQGGGDDAVLPLAHGNGQRRRRFHSLGQCLVVNSVSRAVLYRWLLGCLSDWSDLE